MAKLIGGIVAGILVGLGVILGVELVGQLIYPTGEVDMASSEAVGAMIASLPTGALLFVVLAWFLGALAGGGAAVLISGRRWAAWLIGGLVALSGVANILMYPHPAWMQIAAVIVPVIGGLVAGHFVRARPSGPREAM